MGGFLISVTCYAQCVSKVRIHGGIFDKCYMLCSVCKQSEDTWGDF